MHATPIVSSTTHSLIIGSSGTGRSFFFEHLKAQSKNAECAVISMDDPNLSGLLPHEFLYARRLQNGVHGRLPRGMAKRLKSRKLLLFGVTHFCRGDQAVKPQRDRTPVATLHGEVARYLLSDARAELQDQSGIRLNERQMVELLDDPLLIQELVREEGVDTLIREKLADTLSRHLLGEPWPTYADLHEGEGLHNAVFKDDLPFATRLNRAALDAGYLVRG